MCMESRTGCLKVEERVKKANDTCPVPTVSSDHIQSWSLYSGI